MFSALGIDPSLVATGVALATVGKDGAAAYATALYEPPKDMRGLPRLLWWRDTIREVLDSAKPSVVAIEGYSMGSRGRVFHIGEHGGVLRLALTALRVPVLEVPPATLKQYATGSGAADKARMWREAACLTGEAPLSVDEADATLLASVALAYVHPVHAIRPLAGLKGISQIWPVHDRAKK